MSVRRAAPTVVATQAPVARPGRIAEVINAGREQSVTSSNFNHFPVGPPTDAWTVSKHDSLKWYKRNYNADKTTADDIEHVIDMWQDMMTSADNDEQREEALAAVEEWRKYLQVAQDKESMQGPRGSSAFQSMRYGMKKQQRERKRMREEQQKMLREYAEEIARDKAASGGTSSAFGGQISDQLTLVEMTTISRSADFATAYPRASRYISGNMQLQKQIFC